MAAMAPDPESVSWLRFLIASSTVLALLGFLAFVLKYMALRGWGAQLKGPSRRLSIVESLALDARRRLVIVKCDDAEHLLLLGSQQDSVVASNLTLRSSSSLTPEQNP